MMNELNENELKVPVLKTPKLTLEPQAAQEAAAAQTPEQGNVAAMAAQAQSAPQAQSADQIVASLESSLTPEELKEVEEFAQQIDIMNADHVMMYGADAQKKVSTFADSILDSVKTVDMGDVGDTLTRLISELKGFEATTERPRGLRALFTSPRQQIATLKAKYDDVSTNVDTIAGALEKHQVQLLKDIAMFDQLYELNMTYFHELTMYIVAGEKRLRQVRENELQELRAKAQLSGDAMDAQKANDLAAQCDRFEKKLHDLRLTRQISMQMAPQIRMLQNNNQILVERIQSTLVNTLPLWKNQMVLSLGLEHSQQAMQAQKAVTDMTNELLRKNAEKLKMGTLATAKEAERGIIDMETLAQTNQSLIDTIDEVIRIQREGKQKRAEAEQTLSEMEAELKKKLLTM